MKKLNTGIATRIKLNISKIIFSSLVDVHTPNKSLGSSPNEFLPLVPLYNRAIGKLTTRLTTGIAKRIKLNVIKIIFSFNCHNT